MPEKPDQLPSLPSASEVEVARLAARRRFTRAGLSAPVVLGTLVSKPVLGAPIYHCTVSGHVSGGSPHEGDNASCVVGKSRAYWLAASQTEWRDIKKGTLDGRSCPSSGSNAGTDFNGFGTALVPTGLLYTFYSVNGNPCTVVTTTSPGQPKNASMLTNAVTGPRTDPSPQILRHLHSSHPGAAKNPAVAPGRRQR